MHIDHIKLFFKNGKESEAPKEVVSIFKWRYRDGIWHWKICNGKYEKGKTSWQKNEWNIGKSEKYKNLWILVEDAQHRIRPWEWDEKISLWFWETNVSPNPGPTTRTNDS